MSLLFQSEVVRNRIDAVVLLVEAEIAGSLEDGHILFSGWGVAGMEGSERCAA